MLGALVSVGLMGEVVWGSVVGAAVEVDGCEPMVLAVEPIVAVETSVVVSFTVIVVTSAVLVVGKSLDTLVFLDGGVVWFITHGCDARLPRRCNLRGGRW